MTAPGILEQLEGEITGLQRRGLGYGLHSDPGEAPGWDLAVNRLRISGGELRGQLQVLVDGHHLSAGSFNLSSLSARASTVRILAGREDRLPWAEILERFCVAVLATEGKGEPAVVIGRRRPAAREVRLFGPLLPAGHPSVIFGPAGAGKSTLAAAIAVSVRLGAEVIPGWRPAAPCPVAILDWESSATDWSNLLAAIAEGAALDTPSIAYLGMARPLADDVERVAELVVGVGAELVVVDSVELALGKGREAGDPADAVLRLHQALRQLRATSLLVDHVTGADIAAGGSGASRPYGSVFKLNAARDLWELRREQEPQEGVAELLLVNSKSNLTAKHHPIGLRVIHQGDQIRFEQAEVSAPELQGRLPVRVRMRQALAGGAMITSDLAEELGVQSTSIRAELKRHPDQFTRLGDSRIGLRV